MFLAELWRYPVKSMGGERLTRALLTASGVEGDRAVLVRWPRGRIVTARTRPALLGLHATMGADREPLVDGRPWRDPEIARRVEAAAGAGAKLEVAAGEPGRFDVLPLLVMTDGALNATGYDIIEAPLPVVASVTDQVGEPRYASLKGIMAAKRKPLETWSLADLGISADELHGAALTRVVEVRPPEPKAPTERIEAVPPEEAASRIADWLAARKLI